MIERTMVFPALSFKPTVFFLGTDAEIEAVQNEENVRKKKIKDVVFEKNFSALEYTNSWGQRRILHKSPRKGVTFQMSYIDPDGVPAMHENYIKNNAECVDEKIYEEDDLLEHFARISEELVISILYL